MKNLEEESACRRMCGASLRRMIAVRLRDEGGWKTDSGCRVP